jgi:outer membrane protein
MKRQEVQVALTEVKRQRAGHYPTVDLVGRFNNRDTDGSLFGGGSEVETTEVLLMAKMPLYQGGYVTSRTREAHELFQATKKELVREERAVERQVRRAYQGVLGSIRRVEALGKAVEAQELTLAAKHKGFKSGLLTSIAVLDAERDLYYIRIDFATARYDYLLNSLRLKQGAGILQEQDLATMNDWFGQDGT